MRFHKLQNVQIALDYLRHRQVKLVNIRNDDIADGNPKLTLGLIWTIILHFQISDIQVSGQSEDMTAKEKLLLWSQRMVEGYQGLRCDNFTSSWRDGRLFNAIIHRHKPMLIDMNKVYRQTNLENLDQAFSVAERDLGVTRLLDPEDVDVPQPDEKSIITYVSSLYDAMPRVPDVQDGVKANELQLRWQEYRELVVLLLQWVRQHTAAFEERRFPSSFEEIEILWCQFLKFKETELPAKEADKNRSKGIFQSLEGAVQAGQLKVPPGYHPLDVEKEWGKLHVAILEREKQLRSEFERLECLQRIVSKLQMEAGLCEEQLNQADALLQSDVRLLATGKAPQRAGEVERDLDKADGMIRLLFNDVQTLKDGRHPQGEQMYRRVYRLHERLVAIRTEYNLRLRSAPRHPELEDATLRYLQDLLAWVGENQRRVDSAEWGVDLPSVEAQLGSHRGLHQSIEEFRAKIERARTDEGQLSPAPRGAYRDCLGRLDLQYAKLLNSSKARLRSLESLHGFVAAATKELMWLSEKEDEEVGFDWSERSTNTAAKKDSYSALMRELELKEKKIKEIQNTGDRLLREDHPARPTVESFQAALQTQWSWMLQLCCCVEAHLKENTAYFQFFSDVREAEEQLRKLQETLRRKYTCDRSITVTRLEDLLQDAQDEKDQLNEYRGHLSGLAKRAKAIVQLKPRSPAHPVRGHIPLLAVCDYKQVEVTVHKGDACQLVGPAQPFHWKVLSSSGGEAAVPSVCFLIPPPNQEAQEAIARLEAQHQALVALWHQLHTDMKSLLAWQSLSRDVQLIRSWSLVTFRTLKPEEQRQALRSLELHYQAFLRDSQDAGGFGPEDRLLAEREYGPCSPGEQEESRCQRCISELKDIRLQLEACETRTVHRLRLPLDKEPARECAQRIAEQQKAQAEVEGLGKGGARLSAEAEKVLALPEPSPAAPTLRSELELTLGKLEQVRSLSAIYLEKLKTISLVIRSTQGAEDVLKAHEEQLKEAQAVPAALPELEATKAALKKLRAQAEAQQPVFDALRDELRGAQEVGERLQQRHGERDVEVERWRERVTQLLERWQAVLSQTDVRQRELEQLGRQLRYYRESADPLDSWLQDAKRRQEQIQAVPLANSRAVREQLRQEKALLEEIERHGEKVEECQRFAKQYINAIKDYELQLVTYKAQLEPVASPAKKPKVQSGSESVIQEYVDLRTRYSELTTLTSQYIKFISETLRRMEEEEMQTVQQEQLLQETQALRQSFLSEKDSLLQRERFIEQEKAKLEQLFQEEVAKAQKLREEQQRQQQQMEQEKQQLVASMEEARRQQREAEEGVRRKQEELQRLEEQRQQQEKLLAEENQRLRERLQHLEEEHRAALAHSEEVPASQAAATKALPNGRDALDGPATEAEPEHAFDGLRQKVPAQQLQEVGILSAEELQRLVQGRTTVAELEQREDVRCYLQGRSSIAGLLLQPSNEKLSVYAALRRQLLSPGTALILLEAQAASGFLLDPVRNRQLTVNEAVKEGVVGPELHHKLLSAERAVTGYKDPYTGEQISLFQAMKKGLVLREHSIRLLEAQIATGGIIDPVHSHRLPVDVAFQRGYFDEEMSRILEDPSDDTKGFYDPNTHENLTYKQLLERCVEDPETGLQLLPLKGAEKAEVVETTRVYTEEETRRAFEETQIDIPGGGSHGGSTMSLWEVMQSDLIPEEQRAQLMADFQAGRMTKERMIIIIIEIIEKTEIVRQQHLASYDYVRRRLTAEDLYEARLISRESYSLLREGTRSLREVLEAESAWHYLYGTGCVAGVYLPGSRQTLTVYQALKKGLLSAEVARLLLEAQAATGFLLDPVKGDRLTVDEAVRKGLVGPELHDRLLSAERAVTGYRDPYTEQTISLFQAMKKDLIPAEEALRLLDAQLATGGIVDPRLGFHLPLEVAYQRGYLNKDTYDQLSEPSEVRSYLDPSTDERLSYTQLLRRCRRDEGSGLLLLPLSDARKLTFRGLRKQITVEELVRSHVMDEATALRLQEGLTSIEEVSKNLQKFLEGTSSIAGVLVDATKERLSVYQAMKKGIIRPGTAFELLEAQAATGYVIDPIKGLKLTVEEAVRMGIVGPEFKDKLLSAERAVTGYKDPYSGKLISLFQAMKKGLILKDHGIRLLEAQIATGGIIDPEESHRLPVDVAYQRGLFDEEMNEILADPSDDTKGFFDPNTEENLTYLQLIERCVTDPQTGLRLLPLKEKKRERKTSSKSSVRKRRVVIVDPETGKEMSVYEAYRKGLIDHQTYLELSEQECEWEEITISSSDGVVKSMIIDRRSGRQYDIDEAIAKSLIDRSALDQYRAGTLSITEFADMLSGNAGGFRSRSSSVGSSSSYPISPAVSRPQLASWSDPTEETGPVAGILDTETLEKVSITEAMHRNLVDNITGQRLLEAQACTGGIIDPSTGERFPVTDAVNKGLVDKIMVDRINLAQKAFCGFEDPRTKTKMSAAQALKKGWLYYEAGQRFLEVQYLTGGLIEPDAPGRVPLEDALQRGTVDARTAQKLRDVSAYSKYLTCPKTKLKISYKDALDRSMVEEGTGLRLLEAATQSSKGYYSPYSVSGSGSTAGSRSGSRSGSRAGSPRGSFDGPGPGLSSCLFPSSSP
uniref:Plectin n=1 Tax=Camelus bactrianus TaxID=9837 RepID=A0A9W3GF22_CAMBA